MTTWETSHCSICSKPALAFAAFGKGTHYRHEASHEDRFHWARGGASPAYVPGGELLPGRALHVVEGETDAHAFAAVGLPVVGVLGSSSLVKALAAIGVERLAAYGEVVVWRERGEGGDKFVAGARKAMRDMGLTVRVADWPLGVEDARDLLGQAAAAHRVRLTDDEFGGALSHLKLCAVIERQRTAGSGDARVAAVAVAFLERVGELARDARYLGASAVDLVDAPTAQVVAQVEVPPLYRVSERLGVEREDSESGYVRVIPTPLLIEAVEVDAHDGDERLALHWRARGRDMHASIPREVAASSRRIVDVAARGLPVTSENARGVVRWLHDLEHFSPPPRATVARRAGWALGRHLHDAVDMSLDAGTGTARLLSGLRTAGDEDESIDFVRRIVEHHPMAACMCSAALAAALLSPTQMRGFALHLWGDSRAGKTASMKLALSLWGDPIRLMGSWSATPSAIEAHAAALSDLPTALDELQAAKSVEHVAQMIYSLANGVGRARATITGDLGTQRQWRTVVLTTGEMPLLPEDAHDGARTRTIDIHAAPFAGASASTDAAAAHDVSERAYGWIGRAMMSEPIMSPANRRLLRDEVDAVIGELRAALGSRVEDVPAIKLRSAGLMAWSLRWLTRHVGATDARPAVSVVAAMLAVATDQARSDDAYGSPAWKAANAILDLIAERPDSFTPHSGSREVLGYVATSSSGQIATDTDTAYLTVRGMRLACERAGVPYAKARSLLHQAGVLSESNAVVRRGVLPQPTRCYEVSISAIEGVQR